MDQIIDTGTARRATPGGRASAGHAGPDATGHDAADATTSHARHVDPDDRSAAGRDAQLAYNRWRNGGGQAAYVAYLAAADRADGVRPIAAPPNADAADAA